MAEDPDPARLKALEDRLAALKAKEKPASRGMGGIGHGETA